MAFALQPVGGTVRTGAGRLPARPPACHAALTQRRLCASGASRSPFVCDRRCEWQRGDRAPLAVLGSSRGAQGPYSANGARRLPALEALDENFEAKHTYTTINNWVLPGHVMVGRYPFVEQSRCPTREQGERQLFDILQAGIRTFVSLQNELPPQEDMKLGGVKGFMPYKATAELIAASMEGPPPAEYFEGLRTPMLNNYLPPRRKGETPTETHATIHCVHSPIVDLSIPKKDKLHALLDDMAERIERDEVLYVHCHGGRGRAGTVASCFLVKHYCLSAEEALERVSRAFSTRGDEPFQSPETQEQVDFVHEFAREMSTQSK